MVQSIVKRVHSQTRSHGVTRSPISREQKSVPCAWLTPDNLLPRLDDVLCLFVSSAMPDDLLPTDFVVEPGHPSVAFGNDELF